MQSGQHPFYGHDIYRDREKKYIETILKKYRNEPATEELKKKIWNELQREKHCGNVTIPFKVVMRCDPSQKSGDYVEVILDTKV